MLVIFYSRRYVKWLFPQVTEAELGSFSSDDIKDFSPPQVVEFLAQLVDKVKLNLSTHIKQLLLLLLFEGTGTRLYGQNISVMSQIVA